MPQIVRLGTAVALSEVKWVSRYCEHHRSETSFVSMTAVLYVTSVPHCFGHQTAKSFPDLEAVVRDVWEKMVLRLQTSGDKTWLAAGCRYEIKSSCNSVAKTMPAWDCLHRFIKAYFLVLLLPPTCYHSWTLLCDSWHLFISLPVSRLTD